MNYEPGKTYHIPTNYRLLNSSARQEFNAHWGPIADEFGCTFEPLPRGNNPPNNDNSGITNLNTAGVDQLQSLDGIGVEVAEAIHAYREQQPFESVDDLANVSGVGMKTVNRLRGQLEV